MKTIATPSALDSAGKAHLDRSKHPACLFITGNWTLTHYAELQCDVAALKSSLPRDHAIEIDMTALGELDTAGTALLVALLGAQRLSDWLKTQTPTQSSTKTPAQHSLPAARRALLQTVSDALLSRAEPAPLPE